MSGRLNGFCLVFAAAVVVLLSFVHGADDPYRALGSSSTADTADEAFLPAFSIASAARYLDERAHLAEKSCYACHSTFTYLTARSLIDPLADEVMQTRIMLERFTEKCLDPKTLPTVKTQHIAAVRILAAVELARHDAATTGRLSRLAREGLDAIWKVQLPDGGVKWLHVREAPQAIDDWWPVTMIALGVAAAPDDYAKTPAAVAGLVKLRGWFRTHPPQTNHERALTLLADHAIGGIVREDDRPQLLRALLSAQREDGGWSMASLAPWEKPNKKPIDPNRSDGYATGVVTLALVRGGCPVDHAAVAKAVHWMKRSQRQGGGWFTISPFKRDTLASNTGTSFVLQALAACGELEKPTAASEASFAEAYAKADQAVPSGVYLPDPSR